MTLSRDPKAALGCSQLRCATTFKFCLDPTVEQQQLLARHAGAARFAFNQCLRIVKTALARRKTDPDTQVPWTGFDLINAQQSASILKVALTPLPGLSVKFPSADPVIVYLPPTPVTSALPMSPQDVPEKPAKSRKSTDLTVTSPPVPRTAVKPFALSGVSMVHTHPVCEQVTACGLPVSLPSMVTFAVVLPSAGGCPPQPASPRASTVAVTAMCRVCMSPNSIDLCARPRAFHPRSAAVVASSAGRNASMLSSAAVRSSAVPNVVTVLRNVSSCPPDVQSSSGTATPPRSRASSKPPGYDSISASSPASSADPLTAASRLSRSMR